jgi:hypothetical protein
VSGIRGRRTERTDRRSSYLFQLTAFRDAVTDRAPFATDATAAAEHLRTLDAIYRRAGMQPRP